jgi:hypothetical protein
LAIALGPLIEHREINMRIEFKEEFGLSQHVLFDYFKTPSDWSRLYGAFGNVENRGNDWHAVPLKRFPFPLVARITTVEPNRLVRWQFKGFWRGQAEVRLTQSNGKVVVEGFEEISMRWLFVFSSVIERLFLERRFRAIWQSGWQKLHQLEQVEPQGLNK